AFIGHDCKVVSDCFMARSMWASGYPDQALKHIQAALELAQQLSHSQTLAVAQHFACHIHQLRGETPLAHQRAAELVSLAEEHGLELWHAIGNVDFGWSEVLLGRVQEGIAQIRSGIEAYKAKGAKLWQPHFLGLLALALARSSAMEEA